MAVLSIPLFGFDYKANSNAETLNHKVYSSNQPIDLQRIKTFLAPIRARTLQKSDSAAITRFLQDIKDNMPPDFNDTYTVSVENNVPVPYKFDYLENVGELLIPGAEFSNLKFESVVE